MFKLLKLNTQDKLNILRSVNQIKYLSSTNQVKCLSSTNQVKCLSSINQIKCLSSTNQIKCLSSIKNQLNDQLNLIKLQKRFASTKDDLKEVDDFLKGTNIRFLSNNQVDTEEQITSSELALLVGSIIFAIIMLIGFYYTHDHEIKEVVNYEKYEYKPIKEADIKAVDTKSVNSSNVIAK